MKTRSGESKSRLALLTAMTIFGTIGVFRRYIPLPSGFVALSRAVLGLLFLGVVMLLRRQRPNIAAIRQNAGWLLASGVCLGFNWILLFEAYRYASVPTATLCYYMAPILVVLASPLLFHERLTGKKALCAAAAVAGMVLVSGILQGGTAAQGELTGILLGLAAACVYAAIVLMNKKLRGMAPLDKTAVQLFVSAVVLLPYTLLVERVEPTAFTPAVIGLLVLVGVVHTGVAYWLYFGSIGGLRAQTVALYSYLDPLVAIIASALLLGETMGLAGMIGGALILGAAFFSEWEPTKRG